ncbi:hypothetical protein Q1695_009562 [Nippostrongylus brasiliensis]|nr:hypothetical protein Q1695_009562 [Nippostrongylus brasiliensis]
MQIKVLQKIVNVYIILSVLVVQEFRIPLPLEMSEFRRGLLYSVSEACKSETGGGEGAEFVKQCDFFDDTTITPGKSLSGIYSYKIYKVKSKVPWVLQKLLPEEAFEIHEESWNAYPYCKTMLTNPAYMGDGSYLMIESIHLPDNGKSENPLDIPSPREIIYLDICDDVMIGEANYQPELDPKIFKSTKTGRGQLRENWMETSSPIMCAYKVVTAQFKCMGLGGFIESTIMKQYSKIFANFHRNAFCWIDSWYDLTDEELQKFDEETALLLHKLLHTDERRGVMFDD